MPQPFPLSWRCPCFTLPSLQEGDDYKLLPSQISIGDASAGQSTLELLVETKAAKASWPRGSGTANANSVSLEDFYQTIKPDMKLDAQDSYGTWFESRVLEVKGDKARVHFCGWSSKYDEDIPLDINAKRLAPLHTHVSTGRDHLHPIVFPCIIIMEHYQVRNWRDFRVNDKIDFKLNGRWFLGRIEKVDRDSEKVFIKNEEQRGKEMFEYDFER